MRARGGAGGEAAEAWSEQVRAGRAQVQRLREVDEPADFYRPMAQRFALDPHRTGDEALAVLRSMARPGDTWLDIGAGGGRYALPLSFEVGHMVALEPSAAMRRVLRTGIAEHAIANIEVVADRWPSARPFRVDVTLLAHVGYDIESFGAFLDAAERAAGRCVVVMRTDATTRLDAVLFPRIHDEERRAYPALPQLQTLLADRGTEATVRLVDRGDWGFGSRAQLLEAARRSLYLRPGSAKDRELERIVIEQATERGGRWDLDWAPMRDGVVTWVTSA